MDRRILNGILAGFVFSACVLPVQLHAEEQDARCGDNLTWTLEDGVLTISGTGDMDNWSGAYTPWADRLYEINKVVVEEGVTSIGDEFLLEAYTVTEITLPNTITKIGDYAFECTSISEMVIPDSVETVGTGAFLSCECMETCELSPKMTEISDLMFQSCVSLRELNIPETITRIGSGALNNCYSLTSLTIPDSVTEIGSYAFFCDVNLTDLTLSKNITEIGEYTFAGCSIPELVIPDGVTKIGKYAIGDSAVKKVVVPGSVVETRPYALSNPSRELEVYFQGSAPNKMYGYLFDNTTVNAYYPIKDATWTNTKRTQYGGTVTWLPLECAEGHDYEEEYTAPTFTSAGSIVQTCRNCGERTEAELPVLSTDCTITVERGNAENKIRFCGQLAGYDERVKDNPVVEHGILYIAKSKLGAKTLTTATSGRTKVSFSAYKTDGSFVYTLAAADASKMYVARSYIIVEGEDGERKTYYSPECCVSCDSLN